MPSENVRKLLGGHGLRCTAQREMIYSALMVSKVHPTAEELHLAVIRSMPEGGEGGISLATVYNTLEAFTKHGLARRIAPTRGGSGAAFRYDADVRNHAHVVLVDGSVRDLPPDLSERVLAHLPSHIIAEVEKRMGVKVRRVGVEFVDGGN